MQCISHTAIGHGSGTWRTDNYTVEMKMVNLALVTLTLMDAHSLSLRPVITSLRPSRNHFGVVTAGNDLRLLPEGRLQELNANPFTLCFKKIYIW